MIARKMMSRLTLAWMGYKFVRKVMASRRRQDDGPIRSAGPGAMRNPPKGWDATDERLDETFPASDATAKY